jgi:hypothetical protein
MAALSQLLVHLPPLPTPAGYVAAALLCGAVALNLISLGFLAAVIYPRRFNYVAREPELLAYAEDLIEDEKTEQDGSFSAIATLKRTLADQYAKSTHHNRQINKRRERLRSLAGLATLGSVVMTVLLVVTVYTHYMLDETIKETFHVSDQAQFPSSPRAWLQPRWDKI